MLRFAEVRQAIRSLGRRPGFSLAAILTLALGLAANIAVFHVIYSVLIQPLPFRDPARLVQVWETTPALPQLQVAAPDFRDWRTARSFEGIAAYTFQAMNQIPLLGQGDPEIVHASMATHDLFSTMGISTLMGRNFTGAEESEKRTVALIAERLWRRKFSADPSILGRSIRMGNLSLTVIGVVPSRQAFPAWADIWMPISLLEPELQNRRKYHPLEVVARLKPGVKEEQALIEMQEIGRRLAREYPDTNGNVGARVTFLSDEIRGNTRPTLLLAWAAVGLILLIACANLAHLLLARMLDREREMAIRWSLGAGRGPMLRLVLTESLLLAVMGGVAGTALAAWGSRWLIAVGQGQIPRLEAPWFQAPVWIFALAVTLACGVMFGLPVVWHTLKIGKREAGARPVFAQASRFGFLLMASEVALAFVVLTGAALVLRSFERLLSLDPGIRTKGVLAIDIATRRDTWLQASQFLDTQVLQPIRALPGVEFAAAANCAPMSLGPTEHSRFATRFGIEGRTFDAGRYPVAQTRWVTPDYFKALGIPLKRGRGLTEADRNKPRYLINEALARQFFPDGDPTARRLIMGVVDPHPTPVDIVGVVGDVRDMSLDQAAAPTLYMISTSPVMTVLVKAKRDLLPLAGSVREIIRQAEPEIALPRIRTMDQYLSDSLAQRRFALELLTTLGAVAAFLTAAGIYGVVSYSMSRRKRDLGIRAAVGSTPGRLLRMALREAAVAIVAGLTAGVAIALAFHQLMRTLVYGISALDLLSYLSAGLTLLAIGLFSALLPAWRGAATDPVPAIREQ